ncbi:MAG: MarR family transcriptional regulator [Armatimonadetes bacterium]|nr:MarR family transcriptional regulator [Armatimonadota bacterium]
MSLLEQELQQARPIDDPSLRTILSILKTGDLIRRELECAVESHGVTLQQYNVLLTLREAGTRGTPVLDIAEKMIEGSSNVTRLVDRLVVKGYVRKTRSQRDRRVVYASLTEEGRRLIEKLQGPMQSARRQLCGGLMNAESEHLVGLLEKLRRAIYSA